MPLRDGVLKDSGRLSYNVTHPVACRAVLEQSLHFTGVLLFSTRTTSTIATAIRACTILSML